jgi:hypothetical protein
MLDHASLRVAGPAFHARGLFQRERRVVAEENAVEPDFIVDFCLTLNY